MIRRTCLALALILLPFGFACSEALDTQEPQAETASQSLSFPGINPAGGQRCTIRYTGTFDIETGEFVTTGSQESGCEAGERCVPIACTNAIPPSCFGTCQAPGVPKPFFPKK